MLPKLMKTVLPTMIATMMTSMYSVIDGLFVGGSTGDLGLAAITIAWPLTALVLGLGLGIGGGGSVLLSYYAGRGEAEEEQKTFATMISLLLLTSIIMMTVLQAYPRILIWFGAEGDVYHAAHAYCRVIVAGTVVQILGTGVMPILRNSGLAVHAMFTMIVGILCNIGANYYFLFVAKVGIKGAAYGTVLSQTVVVLIGFTLLATKSKYKFGLSFSRKRVAAIIKSGVTIFGLYIASSITLVFTNLQCLKYGGDLALAAYAVISYIVFPAQSLLNGIGDGTQPLVSFYHGGEKLEELKDVRRIALKMEFVLGAVLALATFFATDFIGRSFGLSQEATGMYVTGMYMSTVAFVIVGFVRFKLSYLNATQQSNKSMTLTFAESLVVSPILLLVLPYLWQVNGVWLAYLGTAIVMNAILFRD